MAEGKQYGFCDYHWEMVMSEDDAQLRRARKKVGMPMPKKYIPPEKLVEEPQVPEQKKVVQASPEKAEKVEEPRDDFENDFQKMLQSGEFNLD